MTIYLNVKGDNGFNTTMWSGDHQPIILPIATTKGGNTLTITVSMTDPRFVPSVMGDGSGFAADAESIIRAIKGDIEDSDDKREAASRWITSVTNMASKVVSDLDDERG